MGDAEDRAKDAEFEWELKEIQRAKEQAAGELADRRRAAYKRARQLLDKPASNRRNGETLQDYQDRLAAEGHARATAIDVIAEYERLEHEREAAFLRVWEAEQERIRNLPESIARRRELEAAWNRLRGKELALEMLRRRRGALSVLPPIEVKARPKEFSITRIQVQPTDHVIQAPYKTGPPPPSRSRGLDYIPPGKHPRK